MKNLVLICGLAVSMLGGCALFGETEPVEPMEDAGASDASVSDVGDPTDADESLCPECQEELFVTPNPIALAIGARVELEVGLRDGRGDESPVSEFQFTVEPDDLVVAEGNAIIGDRVGSGTLTVLYDSFMVDVPITVTARWNAVATGISHGCGVLAVGETYCWGQGALALGTGLDVDSIFPVVVDTDLAFESICSLSGSTVALDSLGDLYGWGWARESQAASYAWHGYKRPEESSTSAKFRRIDCGVEHGCGVTQENDVYCWGANRLGEVDPTDIGDDSGPGSLRDQFPSTDLAFLDVAAGANHTCAVTRDGSVWCWGDNTLGQLGVSDPAAGPAPVKTLSSDTAATEITAGLDHTCVRSSGGKVLCWGDNSRGQLGSADDVAIGEFTTLPTERSIASLGETVGNSTCAIDSEGIVGCWGDNARGQLGAGNSVQEPGKVFWLDGLGPANQVSVGGDYACAVTSFGSIFCWGGNDRWQQGRWDSDQIYTPRPLPEPPSSRVVLVDPAGTYLMNAAANDPTVVELSELGIAPGDFIDITAVNNYEQGDDLGDDERSLVALFSSSAELLESSERERVPGAIAAGDEFETDRSTPLDATTDISGDFEALSTQVVVPDGAQFLFLAVDDSQFDDNEDPGDDFGARITVLPPLSD